MPRAKDPIYRQHFESAGRSHWRCQICIGTNGGRGHAMTRKQTMYHEASRKHSSKAAATFFRHPEIFMYENDGRWFCKICHLTIKSVQKAMAHEAKTHGSLMSEAEIHDPQDALSSGERSAVSALLSGPRGAESYNPQVTSSSVEGSVHGFFMSEAEIVDLQDALFSEEAEIHYLQNVCSSGERPAVSALLSGPREAESYNLQVTLSSGEGSAHGFFMPEAEIDGDLLDVLFSEERSAVSALSSGSLGAESYNPQVASSSGEGSAVRTPLSGSWWAGLSLRTVDSSREGMEAAERDEEAGSENGLLNTPRRSEENGSTTSMHREGTVFVRNDEDNDDNSNNGSDDDDNDNDDVAFIEDFLRCCGVQDAHGPENPKFGR